MNLSGRLQNPMCKSCETEKKKQKKKSAGNHSDRYDVSSKPTPCFSRIYVSNSRIRCSLSEIKLPRPMCITTKFSRKEQTKYVNVKPQVKLLPLPLSL